MDTSDDVDRTRRADLWEAVSDERERLADERDAVADERESLADERDRLLEQRERELERLEQALANQGTDLQQQLSVIREAARRAEPDQGRAAERLARTRQAASRAEGRLLRDAATRQRQASATTLAQTDDDDERAWLLDRRDFVGAERDRVAEERTRLADRRDEAADMREDLADKRERDVARREHEHTTTRSAARKMGAVRLTTGSQSSRRIQDRERRLQASRGREAAARQQTVAAATWGPQAYGPRLVASFVELSSRLFADRDPASVLSEVLDEAVAAIPHCDAAGLTIWRRTSVFDTLATSPAAATLDNIQFVGGEGPAWQSMGSGQPVHVPASDVQWPALAAAARSVGIVEVHSYPLGVAKSGPRSALGAFTMYTKSRGEFGEQEAELGVILAAYLSVAVATLQKNTDIERREASLHRALNTRDVIGQAKGILMERQGLSAEQAFDVLRRASQRLNLKLADAAEHLSQTGSLPGTD